MYKKLKEELKKQGITKYRLAQLTGIASSDIYQCMNGKKIMFNGWKKRIADALESTVEELFPEKDGEKHE